MDELQKFDRTKSAVPILNTRTPAAPAKYVLAESREELSESEVLARCLNGKINSQSWYIGSENAKAELFSSIPQFAEAIASHDAQAAILAAKKVESDKRAMAEVSPDKSLPLQVRISPDSASVGSYLPDQIRYRFSVGEFPASAEFKHPDYEAWFPCLSLFKSQWSHPLINGSTAIVEELKKLSADVTELKKETNRTKWATRSAALFLILIFNCGVKIVLRIQQ